MSKVIFKMTFKHPNLKDTVSKNVSHVNYIARRSGVDKTLTEADLKKELDKGVESLMSDDETYIKYIDERPKSHGLFGADGIEDPKAVQEEISNVSSYVWRSIISLREEDAKKLGYLSKDKWQDMLRKKVPDMANEMGIKVTNLRWAAAVHMEKGHPHAHVMFWEKTPEKTIGIVNNKKLDNIRKLYTDEIFEEERFQLMNDKNLMRDLINDLAKNDISNVTKIIKEVRDTGTEIKSFIKDVNNEGVAPKLFNDDEAELAERLKNLADKMPGKGRIALKFMPEDIKEEVRSIADYLLKQPEFSASLAKNLNIVEELTKMYTGKEDAIKKARDNAYKDIRDRISQIILKGAAETKKDNLFYIDNELSQIAVNSIRNIANQINLIPEQTRVLNEIVAALIRTGHNDEAVIKHILRFSEKENLQFTSESIQEVIISIRNNLGNDSINKLLSSKNIDSYLSTLKLAEYDEKQAFDIINNTIKHDCQELDNKFKLLMENGIIKKTGNDYKLTNKGIDEFLKVKNLDKCEKAIFSMLDNKDDKDNQEIKKASFKEILDNKDVFSNTYNKAPKEFKVGKFDVRISEEFTKDNTLNLKELEEKIYSKYTNDELETNIEKAEKEFEYMKSRIDKLCINGYVEFNKETESYSFTKEGFEELTNVSDRMEFTRYDATVTLNYIDKAENGELTAEDLNNTLHKEIVNQTAKTYYERFNQLLEGKEINKYISIDDKGNLASTEEGKWLGINLSKLNKYIYKTKGKLIDKSIKEICNKEFGSDADKHYTSLYKILNKEVEKGHIIKQESGIYKIDPLINDVNKLLYQLYKEGGSFNKEDLKEVLERNIPNKEANRQYKYLLKRLDNLKEQGYLYGNNKEYSLTIKGVEKREDILIPQRELLRNKLDYLERLGLLVKEEDGYCASNKYYNHMRNIAQAKEQGKERASEVINNEIHELIDRTQDEINIGKIERYNEKIARGKYYNDKYKEIDTDYKSIRTNCNIGDTTTRVLTNLSTTLLVSGVSIDETKDILTQWNLKSNSNIDKEKLEDIIDKSYKKVSDNNLWGKITVINSKDWKEMFQSFGINENNIPKWMYKGENWELLNRNGLGIASIVNDIWKSAWRELERERMQTEAQAEMMKKNQIKQQAASQNKEAIKEQIKKNKDRNSIDMEDDFEI